MITKMKGEKTIILLGKNNINLISKFWKSVFIQRGGGVIGHSDPQRKCNYTLTYSRKPSNWT